MDGVKLQAKLYAGYGKAAKRIGLPCDVYRPVSATVGPLTGAKLATLPAAFTIHAASQFSFDRPADFSSPFFHALIDGSTINVGDYLVCANSTYFVISKGGIVPILASQANRVISVWKPDDQWRSPGFSGYGGTVASTTELTTGDVNNETALFKQWPAGVWEGGKGGSALSNPLPGDVGVGVWKIYLPYFGGIIIRPGFVITDDIGRRMTVRQAELSDLGWNIQAQQAVA